jgi:hypothetical protein
MFESEEKKRNVLGLGHWLLLMCRVGTGARGGGIRQELILSNCVHPADLAMRAAVCPQLALSCQFHHL